MPTCSQAKIISNLEIDITKRGVIINRNQKLTNIIRAEKYNNHNTINYNLKSKEKVECQNCVEQQKYLCTSRRLISKQLNQFSIEDNNVSCLTLKTNHRLPAINNNNYNNNNNNNNNSNNVFVTRRDSVPINFLFNSTYRNRSAGPSRQSKLLQKVSSPPAEHDENNNCNDEGQHSHSESSWYSSGSDNNKNSNENTHREIYHQQQQQNQESSKRFSSNIFSSLPRLALEIEHINDSSSENTNLNEDPNDNQQQSQQNQSKRRFSITGAKRLLALASIRPSKTFHKELTPEEAEILKKYYEIIRPKINVTSNGETDELYSIEKQKLIEIPILYDSAKINYDTFSCLEMFLTEYKSEITSGKFQIDHNLPGYNGFILRNKETDNVIQFPPHVHDTFVALAMSINANGNSNMDENHILRSINWNDTRHILLPKQIRRKNSKSSTSSDSSSVTTSTTSKKHLPSVNIDAIRELTRMLRLVVEPKLLKKVSDNGIDMSALPGGMNFELPPCHEFEYHKTNTIKSDSHATTSNSSENSGKLKNVVYKKLKEKVASTKVMWFSAPPVFKPLSVVFEYAGFDLTHEQILEDVNKCLESVNGQVVEIEFVPRSVHFGSVHVQNLWILTLDTKDAKFYTISHGILINNEKVIPKSYDDYIYTEYEKFIRTEKYKQMIKNHEKAVTKHHK